MRDPVVYNPETGRYERAPVTSPTYVTANPPLPVTGTIHVENPGGGGGGGDVTQPDATQLNATVVSSQLPSSLGQKSMANSLPVAIASNQSAIDVNIVSGGGSGGTASTVGAAVPGTATAVGFSDGTNMRLARAFDTDTGAGTEYTQGVSLRKSASGGSVEAGTASDPIRVDPTGTTTQPISDGGGSLTIDGSVAVSSLPANLSVSGSLAAINDFFDLTLNAGAATAKITVAGTWSGSIGVYGQASDAVNGLISFFDVSNNKTLTRITSDGTYSADVSAYKKLSVYALDWTSGTALVVVGSTLAPSEYVIASQGSGNSTTPWWVTGSVAIENSINVTVGNVTLTGSLPAGSNSIGTVVVSNFPSTQAVSGTIAVQQSGSWAVSINNLPSTQPITGTVHVDNFPATQPITGTITANQGAPGSDAWGVTLTGSLPAGSNTIGSVTQGAGNLTGVPWTVSGSVSLSGSIPAGGNTIGKVDQGAPGANAWGFTLTGSLPAGSNVVGSVNQGSGFTNGTPWTVSGSVSLSGSIPAGTNAIGSVNLSYVPPLTSMLTGTSISAASAGNNTLVTGVSSQTIRVFKMFLICAGSTLIAFQDGTGTSPALFTGPMQMYPGGSITLDMSNDPWFVTSTSSAFVLSSSAAVQISGRIYYTQS